jgi:hypothetical protein
MRRSIDRRAAWALAVALCVAGPTAAAPAAELQNPIAGEIHRDLPFTKSTKWCDYRDKMVNLRPGRYLLTLRAWKHRVRGSETKQVDQDFRVSAKGGKATGSTAGLFKWRDCILFEDNGNGGMRYVHTAQLDRNGVHAAPVTGDLRQAMPNEDKGTYAIKSELLRLSGPADPPRRPDPEPDKPRRPPTEGTNAACEAPFAHRGTQVQYCDDWAPAGSRIPVRKFRRAKARIVDWIDPAGDDWYECQKLGAAVTLQGGAHNTWWAYTLGDGVGPLGRKVEGWVSQTYFRGGGPNQGANLPVCSF